MAPSGPSGPTSEAVKLDLPNGRSPNPSDHKSSLFDCHLVDSSFQAPKFGAAASFQLPSTHSDSCTHAKNGSAEDLLVVSPYTSRSHLLDLNIVDKPDQLMAKALMTMKPIRNDYATAPYKGGLQLARNHGDLARTGERRAIRVDTEIVLHRGVQVSDATHDGQITSRSTGRKVT